MSGASCSSAGPAKVVKVNRELLAACMTCPLCQELLDDATTISECLHTFCRKCIYQKLIGEDLVSCPVCFTHLGCAPMEKLRTDNSLQEMRSKIFPLKRRKVEAPEIVPAIALPIRRKERSLSSLVVRTPRVPSQRALTGRRTRGRGRKAVALRGFDAQIPIKMEEDVQDFPVTSSLPEILKNISPDIIHGDEVSADNLGLQKPLEGSVEATNFTHNHSIENIEPVNPSEIRENATYRGRFKEHLQKSQNCNAQEPVVKKSRRGRKKAVSAKELEREKEPSPIWLSLVSAPDRVGDALLPQLSASYLRIKDSSLPVLLVQKYLAKKLELSSETEVEIFCRGQEVTPRLEIHKLVDIWRQTESSKAVALTGSSAENFVMVLTYARKVNAATV